MKLKPVLFIAVPVVGLAGLIFFFTRTSPPPTQVKHENMPARLASQHDAGVIKNFCDKLNVKFTEYKWSPLTCVPERWKSMGASVGEQPLIYGEFGDIDNPNATTSLFLCGVHGDEISTVNLCFQLVQTDTFTQPGGLAGRRVVVAPLVNPDGFFRKPATRTNLNGVDLNRNFPTQDWDSKAKKDWAKQYKKDKRKNPGDIPLSEPETRFQVALIDHYTPDKIFSAHAPLHFIDYDGPADQKHHALERRESRARFLAMNISKNSKFPLVDFRFYPGSLGNYAGQEKGIPTYTLEMNSSHPSKAKEIWKRFEHPLLKALKFEVTDEEVVMSGKAED